MDSAPAQSVQRQQGEPLNPGDPPTGSTRKKLIAIVFTSMTTLILIAIGVTVVMFYMPPSARGKRDVEVYVSQPDNFLTYMRVFVLWYKVAASSESELVTYFKNNPSGKSQKSLH